MEYKAPGMHVKQYANDLCHHKIKSTMRTYRNT